MAMRRSLSRAVAGWCVAAALAPAADRILVVRPEGAKFEETVRGLKHELGPDFECGEDILPADRPEGAAAALAGRIAEARPKAVVLMDNDAIKLYAAAQERWADSAPYPPSVSLMAIRVDQAIRGMGRAEGIFYEVPGVTILVNLRSLIREPVRKVGVITRPGMADFVRESARWCAYERIELVPFEVPEDRRDVARAVRTGVRRLRDRDRVDALWILNDNFFLTPGIVADGWLPALERFPKPVLVGVENFVAKDARFGAFAILPDHYGLGVQAAGMLLRLKDGDWKLEGPPKVEQPLSVYKILNLEQVRRIAHVNEAALVEMDKVIR